MQTRTKTKTVPASVEIVTFYQVTPHLPEPLLPPIDIDLDNPEYHPETSILMDGGGGRKAWNPVQHFTSRQVSKAAGNYALFCEDGDYYPYYRRGNSTSWLRLYLQRTWGSSMMPYGDPGRLDNGLPGFYVPTPDGNFIPPPADLDSLKARSMRSMLPKIKAELSLVNSILELKDLRRSLGHLAKSFKSNWHMIRNSAGWRQLVKKYSERALLNMSTRKLVQKLAGGYLEYSFNVKPLVSDIRGVISALSQTSKRINDLISRSGRRQKRHFVWTWQEYSQLTEPEVSGAYWDWRYLHQTLQSGFYQRTVSYQPTVFHAEVEYNYDYTPYQIENAQTLAKLDALGVNINPAIIWNALPWSFVVDWVLSIGPYLESMGVQNMEPKINIHRYLWSIRRERRITVTCGYRGNHGLGTTMGQLPAVVQVAYRRQPDSPSVSLLETSGLSLKELSLGAALAVTQSRH